MSCPICNKVADKTYRPFCSKRCADIDLGKWLTSGYSLPDTQSEITEETISTAQKKDNSLH